jgi:hypothetical protein
MLEIRTGKRTSPVHYCSILTEIWFVCKFKLLVNKLCDKRTQNNVYSNMIEKALKLSVADTLRSYVSYAM